MKPTWFKSNPSPKHLLSFKAEKNQTGKHLFPLLRTAITGISFTFIKKGQGQSDNKSTSEHPPSAFTKHKTSPSRGQGDSEGHLFTPDSAVGLSCLKLLLP